MCEWIEAAFTDLPFSTVVDSIVDLSFDGTQYILTDDRAGTRRHIGFDLAHAVIHHVNQMALDHAINDLHLHAGGAGHEGQALVMSGPSGTGKSTLTAQLCERGWDYLSDEAVRLSPSDGLLRSFPKPISFKTGTVELLPDLAHRAAIFDRSDPGGRRLVPASKLGATPAMGLEPSMVVVLRRDRDQPASEPRFEAAAPADVVVRLVEQTMDFDRYPADPLLRISKLVAASWCGSVDIGPPRETVSAVERAFFDRREHTAVSVEALKARPTDAAVSIRDGVTSVRIGQSVVVHDRTDRLIFSLHDEAAEIWNDLLRGSSSARSGPEQGLIAQLREIGVVN